MKEYTSPQAGTVRHVIAPDHGGMDITRRGPPSPPQRFRWLI